MGWGPNERNLSVSALSRKAVYSQWLAPIPYCFDAFSGRESASTPDQVRGRLSLENAPLKRERPHRMTGWSRCCPWTFDPPFSCVGGSRPLGRDASGLFDDGKAHAGLVAVLFRHHAPGILGFLAGLERTLHLGRTFHELVEVHRTELAANHPEIAAYGHDSLLLFRCLNLDFRALRLELRGFGRVVKRRGRRGATGDGGRHQIEVAGADFALMARRRIAVLLGCELGLLQTGVSRPAFGLVAARQFEHAVVERVEARQGHELELITHRADFA